MSNRRLLAVAIGGYMNGRILDGDRDHWNVACMPKRLELFELMGGPMAPQSIKYDTYYQLEIGFGKRVWVLVGITPEEVVGALIANYQG